MNGYEWTKDDLAAQEWAEEDYLARKRERLAPGQAEVEAAAPILREILMEHRRLMAEPWLAHLSPQDRAAMERQGMDVADAAIHRAMSAWTRIPGGYDPVWGPQPDEWEPEDDGPDYWPPVSDDEEADAWAEEELAEMEDEWEGRDD